MTADGEHWYLHSQVWRGVHVDGGTFQGVLSHTIQFLRESDFSESSLEILYHFLVLENGRLLLCQFLLQLGDFTSEKFAMLLPFAPLAIHVLSGEGDC